MKNKETMHKNNSSMRQNTIIIRLVTLCQLVTYTGGEINKYWNNTEINIEIMEKERNTILK